MIKLLTAYTRELDNPEKAAGEIQEGLNLAREQLTHSAAMICCHTEFIEAGVMKAVCAALPFPAVGCSSQYFALPGAADEILLTVTVLTSDDVEFTVGVSGPLDIENMDARIQELYRETAAAFAGKPSLILAFLPMLELDAAGMCAALDRACEGIPVFGTCAMDVDILIRDPQTIYNGAAYRDRMALLLFHGPVQARFFSALFPEKSVIPQDAVITGAEGIQITSINNRSALSFLEDLGIVREGMVNFFSTLPLLIDYHNGKAPEVVVISGVGPERTLICNRNVQTGGILSIGTVSADYILKSAQSMIEAVKREKDGAWEGLFIFSCFSRAVGLGGNPMAEIELIQKELGDSVPYLLFYSGGELCPRYVKSGETVNQFHQYALIACLFQENRP
jgi:hypothetical protein